MDYKQFIQILKDEKSGPDALRMLNEFVVEFPYFQTAQSLLAREMKGQNHVRYERQLKIASAYSPDRKALYNLIHPKKANLFSTEPEIVHHHITEELSTAEVQDENLFEDITGNEIIPPDHNPPPDPEKVPFEKTVEKSSHIVSFKEEALFSEDKLDSEEISEELPSADPHEIIRKRLNEILGLHIKTEEPVVESKPEPGLAEAGTKESNEPVNESVAEETIQEIVPAEKEETAHIAAQIFERENRPTENITENDIIEKITPSEKEEPTHIAAQIFERENIPAENIPEKDIIDKIADESLHAVDVIDRGELEYALEASLIQSLEKLPLIEKVESEEIRHEKVSSGSFFEWLKTKSSGEFGKIEEVHAYDETVQEQPPKQETLKNETSALIDKFIKEEPKIVVSKTEFYSPAIQAKKSITEHEDIVSETLAKIYHQQGNVLRARSMYEKLGLLYPEKKAYFAALIFQIDKDINQHNKQDL